MTKKKSDINCRILPRGRIFTGIVKRKNAAKTIIIEWLRLFYLPKYERYESRLSRVAVHVPDNLEVSVGNKVKVAECRPLSKTKHFVLVEVLK